MINRTLWSNKNIIITGHTGFKGMWLSLILKSLGCRIYGISLKPTKNDHFYNIFKKENIFEFECFGDLSKKNIFSKFPRNKYNFIFHLAAQSLVGVSEKDPFLTYNSNVMGTLNVLDFFKNHNAQSLICITSDKVYQNDEKKIYFKENDHLGGKDLYSSSKACSEILIKSYYETFNLKNKKIVTARAGNIIGGGDFNISRLLPDFIISSIKNKKFYLRNPMSTRPWQYVLDVLYGYLLLAEMTYHKKDVYLNWNFGPQGKSNLNTLHIIKLASKVMNKKYEIIKNSKASLKESKYLNLDSSRSKRLLKWKPRYDINKSINETVQWYEIYYKNPKKINEHTLKIINNYLEFE